MIREAWEEAGLRIERQDVELVHVLHHIDRVGDQPRMGLFFRAYAWSSEPDKCTQRKFWDPAPSPTTSVAIKGIRAGRLYSETGCA